MTMTNPSAEYLRAAAQRSAAKTNRGRMHMGERVLDCDGGMRPIRMRKATPCRVVVEARGRPGVEVGDVIMRSKKTRTDELQPWREVLAVEDLGGGLYLCTVRSSDPLDHGPEVNDDAWTDDESDGEGELAA